MKKVFTEVQELYEDMVINNQSFTKGRFEYSNIDKGVLIEEIAIYRLIELKNGKLHFHGNNFGGSGLYISGKIESAERVDKIENGFCEYRINIQGLGKPLVLMGYKK